MTEQRGPGTGILDILSYNEDRSFSRKSSLINLG